MLFPATDVVCLPAFSIDVFYLFLIIVTVYSASRFLKRLTRGWLFVQNWAELEDFKEKSPPLPL